MSSSDVLWQAAEKKVVRTVWASLSFSVVHLSDVLLQTTWGEVFGARGALHFNALMNLADVLLQRRST